MIDTEAKINAIAEILEGQRVEDAVGLEVCVKGAVLGFPATVQALRAGFPFGVTYVVEVNVLADPKAEDPLNLTVMPRYATGFFGFLTRIFLLESKGQSVGEKKFDSKFLCSFNQHAVAERFIKYPGITERIEKLYANTKFSELGVKSKAGLYLSQPNNFNASDLDTMRVTLKLMGEIGQVLFEAF